MRKKMALFAIALVALIAIVARVEGSVTLNHYRIELVDVEDNSILRGGSDTTTLTYSVKGLVPKGAMYDDLHDLFIEVCPDDIVSPQPGPQMAGDLNTSVQWIEEEDRTGITGVRWYILDSFGMGDEAELQIEVKNFTGINRVDVAVWFGPYIFTNDYLEGHSCDDGVATPEPTPTPPPTTNFYVPVYVFNQGENQ